MQTDTDEDLRVLALENAVKATSGYTAGSSMSSTGYQVPGTPSAKEIVERAQTYFEFLRGDAEKKTTDE